MPPRKTKHNNAHAEVKAKAAPVQANSSTGRTLTSRTRTRSTPTPARSNVRARGRGLDIPNMPWDVLLEIFSVMHPRELLILARTSKDYREFLISRKSARVWKAARQHAEPGLPDCPPFFSEPAYANLVFFPHCHSCTSANVKTVMWEFLARYCQNCKVDMLIEHKAVYDQIDFREREYGVKELLNVIEARPSRGSFPRPFCHAPEYNGFIYEFHCGLPHGADRTPLVKQTAEKARLRKQFAIAMRKWATEQEQRRANELQELKDARLEAVKQRLRNEGYGVQLDTMPLDELKALGPVRQARQLTERGWKSIRDEVVAFMERTRDDLSEA
ncbi:hypothetical protein C8T65DRAFT_730608 [Cerioporus squamosus]|nr:hypothetical protein C8T65DRAFT_730608 [Cerioporus squamosus]